MNGFDNQNITSQLKKTSRNLTRKAIFLSLFIAENCLRRERTAESSGLSGAILSSTIHGWPVKEKENSHFIVINMQCKNCFHGARTDLIISSGRLLTQNFMCCYPCLRIPIQHLLYQILSTIWNARPWFRFKIQFSLQYLTKNPLLCLWCWK